MRSLKKKIGTILLAGVMVVASLVPASAAWSSTQFSVSGHEFEGIAICGSYYATAETEHLCYYDYDCIYTCDVSASLKFYAIDGESGGVETMIGYSYNEDADYVVATYTMTVEERAQYTPSSAEASFTATVGSVSGFDDIEVQY